MNARVEKYKQEIWRRLKQGKLSLREILILAENHLIEDHNIAIRAAKEWAKKELQEKEEREKTKLQKKEERAIKKRKGMSVGQAKKNPKKPSNAGFYGARSSTLTGAPASPKNR